MEPCNEQHPTKDSRHLAHILSQVQLFFVLETALGPIWVWYFINEKPSDKTIIGGIAIILIIFIYTILESRDNSRGKVSPMGDAVAILPAIVATFLICTDPYLLRIVLKSE